MNHLAHVDGDGWVTATLSQEGPRPDAVVGVPCPGELAMAAGECCVLRHAGDHFEVPRDDRAVWRMLRARGFSSDRFEEHYEAVRAARALVARDLDPAVLLPIPAPPLECVLPGLEGDLPGAPGLRYRTMTCLDLDAAAALAVDANIYLAQCPDGGCSPPEAHAWMQLASRIDRPDTWQVVLEFEGRPLQLELITRDDEGHATIGFTAHFTRERPHWFWREAEAPVIRAMRGAGIRSLRSFARADRPDWIAALKRNYGAVEVARLPKTVHLEYPLDAMEARFTGWPARRTAGPGWQWTGPRVLVREATEAEIPWLMAELQRIWGLGHAAVPNVRRILSEQWALDRATLLLGFVDGVLTDVHAYRARTGALVNDAILTRVRDPQADTPQRLIREGLTRWCQRVGYDELSGHIPDAVYDSPTFRRYLQHAGARPTRRHTRFRAPMVEIRVDLTDPSLQATGRWDRWRPEPELPQAANLARELWT